MTKRKKLYKNYKHEGGFVGLPCKVFWSEEYRSLTLKSRCLLDELQCIYRPRRNRIGFSLSRAMDRLNCSKGTAKAAFDELKKAGFIKMNESYIWENGKARVWVLTFQPLDGREPTDEWKINFDGTKNELNGC